ETFGPARTTLNMNEIVTAVLTILEDKITAANAIITCDPLPQVYGHRGRMTRLFSILIDNAIKFKGEKAPQIRISGSNTGKCLEFCVEDNGIGIDEEYGNIIFILFQCLHGDDAGYPGHGIGLALEKKIVEADGGTVKVEAVPGEGSRFKFTLPVSEKG